MVPTSRTDARKESATGDSRVGNLDDDLSGGGADEMEDQRMEGGATGRGTLLWPATRIETGKVDRKHVRVDQDPENRVEGACTRVPFDKHDLDAHDSKGHYHLLPDRQVHSDYRLKIEKREARFWPAMKMAGGKVKYKHVRVHDGQHTCGDRKRLNKKVTLEEEEITCECDDCKRRPFKDSMRVPFDKRDIMGSDGTENYRLLPDDEMLSLYFHDETTTKENDDGNRQWMSTVKGAAIKAKGEGRAAHVSDMFGVDNGPLQLGKEEWAMMQEDKD